MPIATKVNRVVPKNAFDSYATNRQKKLFTDNIARITWTNKISTDTVNLEARDVSEIQIFRIELKVRADVASVLDVIDKAIPYSIVFVVEHQDIVYLSTTIKHPHPVHVDNAVLDWTLKTDWFHPSENGYSLKLRKSIDAVYHDFCIQLSGMSFLASEPIQALVEYERKVSTLEKEIAKVKAAISSSKQFNTKVELNQKLQLLEKELRGSLR